MASHGRRLRPAVAGKRRLFLGYMDLVVLALCGFGLLAAWLVYGVVGTSQTPSASGVEVPIARYLPSDAAAQEATATPAPVPSALASPAGKAASAVKRTAPKPPVSTASRPERIIYPAAAMDVVVHPLKPGNGDVTSRSIVPPETMDGYWLTPYGKPGVGSTNTTYVIGHSWEGLDAPFNHLSSAAAPGDVFTVVTSAGNLRYRVDSVTTYTKSSLKDSSIWSVVPNRLVLISCYTGDLWGKNVAVVASPVRAK
jgi:hypothetical protein